MGFWFFYINPSPPEEAAKFLREVILEENVRVLLPHLKLVLFHSAGGLVRCLHQRLWLGWDMKYSSRARAFSEGSGPECQALLLNTAEVHLLYEKIHPGVCEPTLKIQVTVYLIGQDDLYDREGFYGNEYGDYQDNAERFIFFSQV